MRPRDLDSYCGQETAVGPGTQLRSLIESEHIPSLILWGPPGSRPVFLTVEFCLLDSISCLCAVEFLSFYFFLDLNLKSLLRNRSRSGRIFCTVLYLEPNGAPASKFFNETVEFESNIHICTRYISWVPVHTGIHIHIFNYFQTLSIF